MAIKPELIQHGKEILERTTFAGGKNRQDMTQNLRAKAPAHRNDFPWEPFQSEERKKRRTELQKKISIFFR